MSRWKNIIYGTVVAVVITAASCPYAIAAEPDAIDEPALEETPDSMFLWKAGEEYMKYRLTESLVLTFPSSSNVRLQDGKTEVVIPLTECENLSFTMRRLQREVNTTIHALQQKKEEKVARPSGRKLLRGNKLVIERDGKTYNISGLKVK